LALRKVLIKAGFPDFSFYWLGMGPQRWEIAAGASRSRAGSGPNRVVGRLFSPARQSTHPVFHAGACRACTWRIAIQAAIGSSNNP
jgi:hypothetical protein